MNDTKQEIKAAIIEKGVEVTDADTFRSYSDKVRQIKSGGLSDGEFEIVDPHPKAIRFFYLDYIYDDDGITPIDIDWTSKIVYPDAAGKVVPPAISLQLEAIPKSSCALVAEGWNWTDEYFENVTEYLEVGMIYKPADENTHFFINITSKTGLEIQLTIGKSDSKPAILEWGDGTSEEITGGSGNQTLSHTYSAFGTYECIVTSDGLVYFGNNAGIISSPNTNMNTRNYALSRVFFGKNVTWMPTLSLDRNYTLKLVTLPEGVTSLSDNCFRTWYDIYEACPLTLCLPRTITDINGYSVISGLVHNCIISCFCTSLYRGALDAPYLNHINLRNITTYSGARGDTPIKAGNMGPVLMFEKLISGALNITNLTKVLKLEFPVLESIYGINLQGMQNLVSLHIPKTLKSLTLIDDRIDIGNCLNLSKIEVSDDPENLLQNKDGAIYNKNFTTLYFYPRHGGNPEFEVSNGCIKIANSAFCGVRDIKRVSMPSSLEELEAAAFKQCYLLSVVRMKNCKISVIPGSCFYYATNLRSVDIPESVTLVGTNAFSCCMSLRQIVLPQNVSTINSEAFYRCISLEKMTIKAITPPTISSNSFQGCNCLNRIYVPVGSLEAYKTATNWATYTNIMYEDTTENRAIFGD